MYYLNEGGAETLTPDPRVAAEHVVLAGAACVVRAENEDLEAEGRKRLEAEIDALKRAD
jgi:hypothetical protein